MKAIYSILLIAMLVLVACSGVEQQAIEVEKVAEPQIIQEIINEPAVPKVEEPKEVLIKMLFLLYAPNDTTVKKGTTVTWNNRDTFKTNHRISSQATLPFDSGKVGRVFDSGLIKLGDSYSYTFNEVGEFPYFDPLYRDKDENQLLMAGIIRVVE
tara:strand:+ start:46 stop:510 length:465 start_codon:yes stop_codon:yes gene_type:complete